MLVSLIISSDTIIKILSNKLIGSFHSVKKNQFLKKKPIDHQTNAMKIISLVKIHPNFKICFKSVMFSKIPKDIVKYVEYDKVLRFLFCFLFCLFSVKGTLIQKRAPVINASGFISYVV